MEVPVVMNKFYIICDVPAHQICMGSYMAWRAWRRGVVWRCGCCKGVPPNQSVCISYMVVYPIQAYTYITPHVWARTS